MQQLRGFSLLLVTFLAASTTQALPIDLGLADGYTALSTGQASLAPGMMTIGSSAQIDGNVGARSVLTIGPSVQISGNLDHGPVLSMGPGVSIGGINQTLDTSYWDDVYDDLVGASNTASALQVGNSLIGISGSTILGSLGGGLSVYHITGSIVLSQGQTLTLQGGAQDQFIINVDHGLTLAAGSSIQLDGVLAGNVLFNFTGQSYLGDAVTIGAASFDGTYISPNVDWQFGPGSSMEQTRVLVSGIQGTLMDMSPPQPIPAPSSVLLLALGLAGFGLRARQA